MTANEIERLLSERRYADEAARAEIEAKLAAAGVEITDVPNGVRWTWSNA